MTAKDKAKELIQLFYNKQCSHSITELAYKSAKQSALICVDEMLDAVITIADKKFDFYTEVKKEIEKL